MTRKEATTRPPRANTWRSGNSSPTRRKRAMFSATPKSVQNRSREGEWKRASAAARRATTRPDATTASTPEKPRRSATR